MGDTNYISSIVKILEKPSQKIFDKNILITEVRAQLPQTRNNVIVSLTFWGKLSQDIIDYYNMDDYIIIEGYLSLLENPSVKNSKKVKITVLKVYPFLLSYNQQNSKI